MLVPLLCFYGIDEDLGTWTAGSGFQNIALMDSILGRFVFPVEGKSLSLYIYILFSQEEEGECLAARTQCRRGLSCGLLGDRDPSR